jgi:hypothetical protein
VDGNYGVDMSNESYHASGRADSLFALLGVSAEMLAAGQEMRAAMNRWMTATPDQRDEWARQDEARRVEERAAAGTPVALTLDGLLNRLGFSREYAEHLMQPYCECYDSNDGWDYCMHARDLGLTR